MGWLVDGMWDVYWKGWGRYIKQLPKEVGVAKSLRPNKEGCHLVSQGPVHQSSNG